MTARTELSPDFSSATTSEVVLPGSDLKKTQAVFTDPMLAGYSAVVINDSLPPSFEVLDPQERVFNSGERLTTMVVRFPRCVLSEFNTHRVFSRNSASSRARSMSVTIKELMEDPYIPLFTRNQRGMGGKYLTAAQREVAVEEWLKARDAAVAAMFSLILADTSGGTVDGVSDADGGGSEDIVISADTIRDTYPQLLERYSQEYQDEETTVLSVHKQNANRILEPFMWHEVIVSATDWENYFQLRDHDEAQPEIRAIARLMKDAMDASTPVPVWAHTPFEDEGYRSAYASGADYDTEKMSDPDAVLAEFMDAFMSSAGDCARVSYKSKLAQGSTDSTKLGYRLLDAGHLSPFEHVAVPVELMGLNGYFDSAAADDNYSSHWIQFRTLLALTQHGTGSAEGQK